MLSVVHEAQAQEAGTNIFYALLQAAREKAEKNKNFSSTECRKILTEEFQKFNPDRTPYDWQLDVTEALILGLDSVVIAGTGAGKTMPFALPLLADKTQRTMEIVLSPLNELEQEQAERFKMMGLTAIAVNGETYSNKLHEELESRKYRVIFTSPEMCLEHPQFSKLLRSDDFTKDLLMITVDEAHCVSQWGENFRKTYAEICKLRSLVPIHVPFLATSATLPPFILTDVLLKLGFPSKRTFILNLGNDRPNITPLVCKMRGASSDLDALRFVVDEALETPIKSLQRTIIFFNTRDLAYKGCKYLQQLVPDAIKDQIDFLHAGRTLRARKRAMRLFREGKINILCATEAAGMGMDIPDIVRVVQFMVPSSLSVWIQRAGPSSRPILHPPVDYLPPNVQRNFHPIPQFHYHYPPMHFYPQASSSQYHHIPSATGGMHPNGYVWSHEHHRWVQLNPTQ